MTAGGMISGDRTYTIRLRETQGKKIYVDPLEREGIFLYPGEIRKEKLEDGQEISGDDLSRLRRTYALPRAKKRALGILARRDQTESQLREKLRKSSTDSLSLEEALDFVRDYGCIDDRQYARDYLSTKRGKKSFRQIRQDLMRKGISREILDELFLESGEQETGDLRLLFDKYVRRFPVFDREAAGKTYAHFIRKGYSPDLLSELIRERKSETI